MQESIILRIVLDRAIDETRRMEWVECHITPIVLTTLRIGSRLRDETLILVDLLAIDHSSIMSDVKATTIPSLVV